MLDILLVAALLAVSGVLFWSQRSEALEVAPESDRTVMGPPDQGYFWRLARPAGLSPDRAWPIFLTAKLLLALALPSLAAVGFNPGFLGAALLAAVGFFVPDALVLYVKRERQANIRRSLSFFLDLLVSLLQAGLTLEEAFKRAAREGLPKGHPLAEEASLLVDELDLGRDRTAGFLALAERTGVRELRALASALTVGLGIGASIETTLRAQADLARAKRREDGIRRLQIASAEILLPLFLCGFPVFVVIVFFPLAMMIMKNLSLLGQALR